ncbi:mannan-binding lectin [Paramuricea clavata]|uniref:Mannan-binding lectin, partial n=1 Tax=Paramuricea clavata TaxID=317549 RepID=A0A6S7KGC2_PARCT|nr:mannan-binding lectin [Paramuricea clavata]
MAVPSNATNNQHIYQAMKSNNVGTAYIGFYRVSNGLETNKFYTVRGVEASYTNWLAGEPNNSGAKEDCVELVYKSPFWKNGGDVGGQWNDLPCKGYPRHYVCETSFQRYDN